MTYVISYGFRDGALAAGTMWESGDRGRSWHRSLSPIALPAGRFPASAATAGRALFVLSVSNTQPGSELLSTSDGGATWRDHPAPCGGLDPSSAQVAAVSSTNLWLACDGSPGAGNEAKSVYRSQDGGAHWTLAAGVTITGQAMGGTISAGGYVDQLVATSAADAYLSLTRGGLLETSNGGHTWTTAIGPGDGLGITLVYPLSPTIGLATVSEADPNGGSHTRLWHTINGTSWSPGNT